jgi:hypothetical protein
MGFDHWLANQLEQDHQIKMTQCSYLSSAAMQVEIVLKLEQLPEQWHIIQRITGCHESLPRTNVSKRLKKYYYTKTSKKMVWDWFRADFERFGYPEPLPVTLDPRSDIVQQNLLAPWFEIPQERTDSSICVPTMPIDRDDAAELDSLDHP